jgi:hypothetical protein
LAGAALLGALIILLLPKTQSTSTAAASTPQR